METNDLRRVNELVTGAPGTIKLGDRTVLVAQPSDADFITLRKELRRQFVERRKSPLQSIVADVALLPPHLQTNVIREAVGLQNNGGEEPTGEQVMEGLYQPEGCRFWVWYLARKCDPTLKLEDLSPLIDEHNVDEVLAALLEAAGLKDSQKNSAGRTGS